MGTAAFISHIHKNICAPWPKNACIYRKEIIILYTEIIIQQKWKTKILQ